MIGSMQRQGSPERAEDGWHRDDLGSVAFELGVLNGSAWAVTGIALCALIGIETPSPVLGLVWLGASLLSTVAIFALIGLSTGCASSNEETTDREEKTDWSNR